MRRARLAALALMGAALAPLGAWADETCRAASEECVPVGHWNFGVSLGAGVRTNPLVGGKDIPLVAIPQFSYYGKRFFIDDLDVGFSLFETANMTVSFVASPGYDRVYFYRSDLQNIFVTGFSPEEATVRETVTRPFPQRARSVTYLAGPEWTFKSHGIAAQLDILHDITGHDHGTEIRAAVSKPIIESHGVLSANAGLTWKSASIVDYYYGAPGYYEGGPALDPFVKLAYVLPLSRKWKLSALFQFERLADTIAESPLLSTHYVETAFVGATYTW